MGGGCFDSELDLRRGRSSSISEKAMIYIDLHGVGKTDGIRKDAKGWIQDKW